VDIFSVGIALPNSGTLAASASSHALRPRMTDRRARHLSRWSSAAAALPGNGWQMRSNRRRRCESLVDRRGVDV